MLELGHHVSLDAQASIPDLLTESSLACLASYVLDQERVAGLWSLAFRFTTYDDIQRMHLEFMGIDSPTDIMTFPYDDLGNMGVHDPEQGTSGGDIVISVDQASAQAVDQGWSTLDELWFLSIHGVLHLVGWDDHDDSDRTAMLDRQSVLLNDWKAKNSCAIHASEGKTRNNESSD